MIEVIVNFFAYLFIELIFETIILGIFRTIKWIGLASLKMMTFSKKSVDELKIDYKGSILPYFTGIVSIILIVVVYKLVMTK